MRTFDFCSGPRSWGQNDMNLGEPYWAAPTAVPSPSELPSYTPRRPPRELQLHWPRDRDRGRPDRVTAIDGE